MIGKDDLQDDASRIRKDAARTRTLKDLTVKALVQRDWSQEETASPVLRQQSETAYQIYRSEIARRRQSR